MRTFIVVLVSMLLSTSISIAVSLSSLWHIGLQDTTYITALEETEAYEEAIVLVNEDFKLNNIFTKEWLQKFTESAIKDLFYLLHNPGTDLQDISTTISLEPLKQSSDIQALLNEFSGPEFEEFGLNQFALNIPDEIELRHVLAYQITGEGMQSLVETYAHGETPSDDIFATSNVSIANQELAIAQQTIQTIYWVMIGSWVLSVLCIFSLLFLAKTWSGKLHAVGWSLLIGSITQLVTGIVIVVAGKPVITTWTTSILNVPKAWMDLITKLVLHIMEKFGMLSIVVCGTLTVVAIIFISAAFILKQILKR